MRIRFGLVLLLGMTGTAAVWPATAPGQQKAESTPSPAQLELTAEVAATTQDGLPSVLRITLRNVGNVAVDLPGLGVSCQPNGGVLFQSRWTSTDSSKDRGIGYGCASSEQEPLVKRVQNDWIRLQPGEYLTESEVVRGNFTDLEPGSVEYWVEYTPPTATREERRQLEAEGYVIPTDKLETPHQTFSVD